MFCSRCPHNCTTRADQSRADRGNVHVSHPLTVVRSADVVGRVVWYGVGDYQRPTPKRPTTPSLFFSRKSRSPTKRSRQSTLKRRVLTRYNWTLAISHELSRDQMKLSLLIIPFFLRPDFYNYINLSRQLRTRIGDVGNGYSLEMFGLQVTLMIPTACTLTDLDAITTNSTYNSTAVEL